jgi:hypothetical protein
MQDKILEPLYALTACFSIASLAGIAALLRSDKTLHWRTVLAAGLYSGLFGLVIGLIWYNYFAPANVWFLIGVSGLAGLGGVSLIDVLVQLIAKGVNIRVTLEPEDDDNEPN